MSTHLCGVFIEPSRGGGAQCGMFSVVNISKMFTHSLLRGVFGFSHILVATFSACENIHKVVAFTVNFLFDSVFFPVVWLVFFLPYLV